MSDEPIGDPIFLEQPQPVGAPPAMPEHEREKGHPTDEWVVVDRVKGEGAKSKLESAHRKLEHAGIDARIEHDSEGRIVLEVHQSEEKEAVRVMGAGNTHGVGENAHQLPEDRIEQEEKEALKGPFKAANTRWFVIALVVVFALFLIAVTVANGFYHWF
jgi:aminoglycoside phosphotransferase (APT) family kinase protein